MRERIFLADLTPCDNMQDYREAAFVPAFVTDDTRLFDTDPPMGVIQVATPDGWCIVAKWGNNGSTRIYAMSVEALYYGVAILSGRCDSGECNFAYGEEVIRAKYISDTDRKVFFGHCPMCDDSDCPI